MERLKKKHSDILFSVGFNAISNFRSSLPMLSLLHIPHLILIIFNLYRIIEPDYAQKFRRSLPHFIIFGSLCGSYIIFIILSLVCHSKGILLNVWGHLLLLFDSLSGVIIQLAVTCQIGLRWCQQDTKAQIIVEVGSVVYIVSCAILRSVFYYPFHDTRNWMSMNSGIPTFVLVFYKIVLSLLANIPLGQERIICLLMASMVLFLSCCNRFHRHHLTSLFWNCCYFLFLWASLLLYLIPLFPWLEADTKQQKMRLFKAVWIYSTPFALIFVISMHHRPKWQNFFKQHTVQQEIQMYNSVSSIGNHMKSIRKSELKMANIGYQQFLKCVKQHNNSCLVKDCSFKSIDLTENIEDDRVESKVLAKNVQICLEEAEKLIIQLQNSEPSNAEAQIFATNFSFECLKTKQKGLLLETELDRRQDITAWQRYSLYYLRRKVEKQNSSHFEVSQQSNDNLLSQFQHNIEMSASMLSEFWYLLSDPKCNTKKLYDLANVIFPLRLDVDRLWLRVEQLKNIQSYGLYAKYLIELFNDKESGIKVLEQAKKIDQEIRNRKEMTVGLDKNSNNLPEEHGVIFLEVDQLKSGTMYMVNLAAEKIFGYEKGEMLNRKVNDIMPRTYSIHHDQFLLKYAQHGKVTMMNKERLIWGRAKSGYLFPFTILIKPIKNIFSEKVEIYGSLRRQPWLKEAALIVLSPELIVTDVSSSILNLFPSLTLRSINKKKINILEIIPDFLALKAESESSRNVSIEIERSYIVDDKQEKQTTVFTVNVEQINVSTRGCIGYLVKFLRTSIQEDHDHRDNSSVQPVPFEFTFVLKDDRANKKQISSMVGTYCPSELQTSRIHKHMTTMMNKKVTENVEQAHIQTYNYGEGIKSKRLVQNQLKDVHSQADDSQDFEQEASSRREEDSLKAGITIRPAELSAMLAKPSNNPSIYKMKIVTLVILLANSAIIGTQYSIVASFKQTLENDITNIKKMHELKAQVLYMKQFTLAGMMYPPKSQNQKILEKQVTILDQLSKQLQFRFNTTITYFDGSSQNMLTMFALSKLVAECNFLMALSTQYNAEAIFVNYNTLNDLIISLDRQLEAIMTGYNNLVWQHRLANYWFACSILPLVMAFSLINNTLLKGVLKKKTEVLEIFFEIPRRTCRNLQKDCQRFIQKFAHSQQNEDMQSEMDYEESDTETRETEKQSKRKKRTIEGEDRTRVNFLIAVLFFLIVLAIYPALSLAYFELQQNSILKYGRIMKIFTKFEPSLVQCLNGVNSLYLTPPVPIFNSDGSLSQSTDFLKREIDNLFQNDRQFNTEFYIFKVNLDKKFLDFYDKIMFESICQTEPCLAYSKNGLNLLYSKTIFYVIDKFQKMKKKQIGSNLLEDTILNEISTQQLIKKHIRSISQSLLEAFKKILNYRELTMFSMMVTLIVFNLLTYCLGWMPFYNNLETKIVATEYILTFIPITQINKNTTIINYLKEKMLEKKGQDM